MSHLPPEGIYETKSFPSQQVWPENRRVYIQGSTVRLVNYRSYGVTDEEHAYHQAMGYGTFDYNWFFEANVLGPRVSDLPEGFDIRSK